jgi:hypothetical protein
VEYPFSFRICASGAAVSGRIEVYPGAEVAPSVIAPHPDRVMIAAGQQRLSARRAQSSDMELVIGQAPSGQTLGGRRRARTPEPGAMTLT